MKIQEWMAEYVYSRKSPAKTLLGTDRYKCVDEVRGAFRASSRMFQDLTALFENPPLCDTSNLLKQPLLPHLWNTRTIDPKISFFLLPTTSIPQRGRNTRGKKNCREPQIADLLLRRTGSESTSGPYVDGESESTSKNDTRRATTERNRTNGKTQTIYD